MTVGHVARVVGGDLAGERSDFESVKSGRPTLVVEQLQQLVAGVRKIAFGEQAEFNDFLRVPDQWQAESGDSSGLHKSATREMGLRHVRHVRRKQSLATDLSD